MEKLIYLDCERCGYSWPQRGEHRPKVCPNCKSLVWDKPLDPYWKHIREENKKRKLDA